MYKMYCNENPVYVSIFWELRGLSPNFHIHVSLSVLYIPMIGHHILLQQNRQTDCGNKYRSQTHECGNWDCGHAVPFLGIFVSNFRKCVFAVWEEHYQKECALYCTSIHEYIFVSICMEVRKAGAYV